MCENCRIFVHRNGRIAFMCHEYVATIDRHTKIFVCVYST